MARHNVLNVRGNDMEPNRPEAESILSQCTAQDECIDKVEVAKRHNQTVSWLVELRG